MKNKFKRVMKGALLLLVASTMVFNVAAIEVVGPAVKDQAIWRPSDTGLQHEEADVNHYVSPSADGENIYDVTLEISGKTQQPTIETDVVLVLDVSGSMIGNRIEQLKRAVKDLSKQLLDKGGFKIALVNYSASATVGVEFTQDYATVEAYVDTLEAYGATFTQAGLAEAKELFQAEDTENKKVIILISDGTPTGSYLPTAIAPIEGDEVRAYPDFTPTYKVTEWDYTKIIGNGATYAVNANTDIKVGDQFIYDHGESTIGELLEFKKLENTEVFTMMVEIPEQVVSPDIYLYKTAEDPTFDNAPYPRRNITLSWTEEIQDHNLSSNETAVFTAKYEHPSDAGEDIDFSFYYRYADKTWGPKMIPFLKDPDAKCVIARVDGQIVGEFTYTEFGEIMDDPKSIVNQTLSPGQVYTMELTLELNDFENNPTIDPIPYFNHGAWGMVYYLNGSKDGMYYQWYAKCVRIAHERYGPLKIRSQAEYVLRNLSSTGVEGETFFDVEDVNDLRDTLMDKVYPELINSVILGTASAPIASEYVTFVPGTMANGKDFVVSATREGVDEPTILDGVVVSYNPTTKEILATGLNLGFNEQIIIQYKVKLETELEGFEPGKLYPVSANPILIPVEGGENRPFPLPRIYALKDTPEVIKPPVVVTPPETGYEVPNTGR